MGASFAIAGSNYSSVIIQGLRVLKSIYIQLDVSNHTPTFVSNRRQTPHYNFYNFPDRERGCSLYYRRHDKGGGYGH